ncbi:DUF7351 domain-containing protein [Halomarina oriensis]|uniref:ArsR family transcriptional regulator n=1 Tax=Halomarina oriensis TaxID=671145 RepID=A0A6B0GG87_9EURY|nr:hypothetical protein [Halomarina oriensis]MWG33714.1 hypothetical protein [Halomarina oriensis]
MRSGEGPFSLLADETRLGVVEALGDATDGGRYAKLSYSDVRAALPESARGNLNYHLRKLRNRFVRRTDDGYRLSTAGIRVYQAISAGAFHDERPVVDPTPVERRCGECADRLRVAYRDGRAEVRCPTCERCVHRSPLPPNAFDPASPADLLAACIGRARADLRSMWFGLCPYCSGYVDRDLSAAAVTNEGADAVADLRCTLCGWSRRPTLGAVVDRHHAATVFYEERAVTPPTRPEAASDRETEVRETDPLRVVVTTRPDGADGDTLRHVVDEDLQVVEWAVNGSGGS